MKFEINGVLVAQIPELPNYAASKCGRIFRISTRREMKQRPIGRSHYLGFRACHNNVATTEFTHVSVARAWLHNPDPEIKTQVNHIDGDKQNPVLDNLEWVSPAENQRHAYDTGLQGRGDKLYNGTLSDDQVHLICKELEEGAQIKYLADKFCVSKDIISKIRTKSTYFHIVRYYDFNYSWKTTLSENTVRWVCERILEGIADMNIPKLSTNKLVTTIEVKRIRHKVKYKTISDEYF